MDKNSVGAQKKLKVVISCHKHRPEEALLSMLVQKPPEDEENPFEICNKRSSTEDWIKEFQ